MTTSQTFSMPGHRSNQNLGRAGRLKIFDSQHLDLHWLLLVLPPLRPRRKRRAFCLNCCKWLCHCISQAASAGTSLAEGRPVAEPVCAWACASFGPSLASFSSARSAPLYPDQLDSLLSLETGSPENCPYNESDIELNRVETNTCAG